MLLLSYLSSFAGLGLLLVRAHVRRPMYCRMSLLVLQLYAVKRYGYKFSSSSSAGSPCRLQRPLTPSGGRGEMAMSHPRCARLFFLHSEPSQEAPARHSVCPTGACSSQLYSAKCLFFNGHRHWSRRPQPRGSGGGAERRTTFPSHETQRLAPGRAKSQVPRDARCWWTYQRASWECREIGVDSPAGTLRKGRPSPKLAGD